MMEFHKIQTLEKQWLNETSFTGFKYEAVEISIYTTEGFFSKH